MLKNFLTKGDSRSVKAKKNIFYSLGIKGIDSLVQLLLVPVALGYLNPYEYGIWLTLSSILVWINSFDIGLGNGLRNQLATAVAKNDWKLAKVLVSTAYCMIFIIMLIIMLIGSVAVINLNWYELLGAKIANVPNLTNIVFYTFLLFCINFAMKFIGNVYMAMQMPSVNNLMVCVSHMMALILIYILTITTKGSLLYTAIAFSISPIIVYAISYPITFGIVYKNLVPNIHWFDKQYIRSLFNIGVSFFILQISGIILFSLSNLVISKMFGPDHVTPYNISFRYFSLVTMLMSLVITPLWSATTDALAKNEFDWIKRNVRKTDRILLGLSLILLLMVLFSGVVYHLWLGDKVQIPFNITSLMALYTLILTSSAAYSIFLNGMGILYLQIINTIVVAILYLPLTYCLGRFFDLNGIIISMCLLNISGLILNRVQLHKVINSKAKGIWIK